MTNQFTVDLQPPDLDQAPGGLNARDKFRGCYSPEPMFARAQRHWLLDRDTGRDLLKAAARKYVPEAKVPLFWNNPKFDHVLNDMIDRQGLREMKEPQTALGAALLNFKLGWMILRVQTSPIFARS